MSLFPRTETERVSARNHLPRRSRGNEAHIIFDTAPSQCDRSLVTSAATIFQTPGKLVWAVVLLTSVLSGCIVVPLPNRDTGNPRKDLGQPTSSRIEPGVAAIEDVLLKLGEPDSVSPDERSLAYRSQKTLAMWIAAGGYSAGGGSIDEV